MSEHPNFLLWSCCTLKCAGACIRNNNLKILQLFINEILEKLDDPIGETRSCKSKDRQYNNQMKKDKGLSNDIQSTEHYKDNNVKINIYSYKSKFYPIFVSGCFQFRQTSGMFCALRDNCRSNRQISAYFVTTKFSGFRIYHTKTVGASEGLVLAASPVAPAAKRYEYHQTWK